MDYSFILFRQDFTVSPTMNNVETKGEELVRNTINEKKRSHNDDESVASALLALDGGHSSKRRRPSTPKAETRDSIPISTPTAERRESHDNDREQSSPISTTKLSHRFMSRFEVTGPLKQDVQPVVSENRAGKADSNELASAMALASLANQKQSNPMRRPNAPDHHGISGMYPHHPPMQMPQSYPSQMHPPPIHTPNQMHKIPPYMHHRPNHSMYTQGGMPSMYNHTAYGYHPGPVKSSHSQTSSDRQWACDFCGNRSFSTYEQACNHEQFCQYNPRAIQPNKMPMFRPRPSGHARAVSITSSGSHGSSRSVLQGDSISSPADEDESKFFCGAIKLHVPAADPEWLSEMNCFIRKNCIEAFSANEGKIRLLSPLPVNTFKFLKSDFDFSFGSDDVFKSSKRGRIAMKQVGIRCVFCAKEDVDKRAMSAISYPVSSSGIYESVKRWNKIHLPLCKCIPKEIKDKIEELEKSSSVPTTRQYWIDSARALGIEDTPGGLRFTHNVNDSANTDRASRELLSARSVSKSGENKGSNGSSKGNYIVFPEDESVITPFLYALLRQLEPCQFTDADRYIARSRCSQGFNGFQCRHCSGHAGLGKYFPTSPKALSTNSTSQNIFSHVLKCRKCPEEVKEKLKSLKYDKGHWTRRTTGWRQKFFEDVWKRLHGDN